MSLIQTEYPSPDTVPVTCTLTSLANSATLIAGQSSLLIDNRVNKDLNHIHRGKIGVHNSTNVTANTKIEVWALIPLKISASGVTVVWPDVFTGADLARTITNLGIKSSCLQLVDSIDVIDVTPGISYPYSGDIASLFNGMPQLYQLFFTQNTGQILSATAGNHVLEYERIQAETV
jgi:hypothetical protein